MLSKTDRSESIGVTSPKTSRIDLSNSHITTLDFFRLQPVYTKEMIPGDTFSVDVRSLISAAPLANRVLGKCHLDIHAFFVPNRILWKDWENYFFGNKRSSSSTDYTHPYFTSVQLRNMLTWGRFEGNSHFGLHRILSSLGYPAHPTTVGSTAYPDSFRFNSMPLQAYQRIWWDYYRDSVNIEEYTKDANLPSVDGGGMSTSEIDKMFVRYRTFRKDYISTLLSNPQVSRTPSNAFSSLTVSNPVPVDYDHYYPQYQPTDSLNGQLTLPVGGPIQPNTFIRSSIAIPVLRAANATQRFLERLNISGTRPIERIMALFGINSPVVRHDMSEFIGSTSIPIGIDGLINTGSSSGQTTSDSNPFMSYQPDNSDFGTQLGLASATGQSPRFNYSAKEHGFFMIIASVIPEFTSPNVIDRMLLRGVSTPNSDARDYYTPDYDGITYQPVTMAEVANPSINSLDSWKLPADGGQFDPFALVGYQPPYEDYRISRDMISGDFVEQNSKNTLYFSAFQRDLTKMFNPDDVHAGLNLTTSDNRYRSFFDSYFIVTRPDFDHFKVKFDIVNNAVRPITSAEIPTELSNLANSDTIEISKGGVRL